MGIITNQRIATFRDVATQYLRNNKHGRTKLSIAADKLLKKTKSAHERYLDEIDNLRDDHASVDKDTKCIIVNANGNNAMTPEKSKDLRKKIRELMDAPVTVDAHFVIQEEQPGSLEFTYPDRDNNPRVFTDYDVREAFTDFIIKPEEE